MRIYKYVLAVFAILVVLGVYITMQQITPKGNETETPSTELQGCYETALKCKADEGKCSLCGAACTDVKGNPVKENAVQNCRLGRADKILNKTGGNSSGASEPELNESKGNSSGE